MLGRVIAIVLVAVAVGAMALSKMQEFLGWLAGAVFRLSIVAAVIWSVGAIGLGWLLRQDGREIEFWLPTAAAAAGSVAIVGIGAVLAWVISPSDWSMRDEQPPEDPEDDDPEFPHPITDRLLEP